MDKRILITGGHLTPALSVLEELQRRGFKKFIWVGHKYTMIGDKEPGFEYKIVSSKNIPFYNLTAGKIYRYFDLKAVKSFLNIPVGFFEAFRIVGKTKPDLILSFGGYLAVPVVFAGFLRKISIVTHEQTSIAGLANKVISYFAKQIYITWPQSEQYFSKNKVILTGNPLRKSIFVSKQDVFDFKNSLPILYITGGNQGSHILNNTVKESLQELLKNFNIIHQCGSNSIFNDYQSLIEAKEKLDDNMKSRYIVEKSVEEESIGSAFGKASIVIGRAGANTIYELISLKKPSIIIPLPFSSHNEQFKNAEILEDMGLGEIIEQNNLTSPMLIRAVKSMYHKIIEWNTTDKKGWSKIQEKSNETVILNAQIKIADEIEKLLGT